MQDGTVLGDVQLPPWADGDPHKFILLHRQVSEYQVLGHSAELKMESQRPESQTKIFMTGCCQ